MSADPPADTTPPAAPASAPAAAVAPSASALPSDVLADVEREQQVADLQAALSRSEALVESLRKEKDALINERDGAVSTSTQLRDQLTSVQSAHHQASSQLSVTTSRVAAVEAEKAELAEDFQRLKERSNETNQELYRLRLQKNEASQTVATLRVEVSELKMAADSAKFNEQRSIQALQSSRNEVMSLTTQNTELEERFSKYRASSQSAYSELQQEKDRVESEIITAKSSYNAIQRTYQDQSQRLAEAHANIHTLTNALAKQKTENRLELERIMAQNALLEKYSNEARDTVQDRESELEQMAERFADKERAMEEQTSRLEAELAAAKKRADDFKFALDRFTSANESSLDISPTATLAAQHRASGQSYTQIWTQNVLLEDQLNEERTKTSRLESMLQQIGEEVMEKKPIFDQQRKDFQQAVERANVLAGELSSAITDRDAAQQKARGAEAEAKRLADEVASHQTTVEDLAHQVRELTRQLALRDNPNLAYSTAQPQAVSDGDMITDHFVAFKSLEGLQQQNQRLLTLTRSLASKLSERETHRAEGEASTGLQMDQAAEIIEKQRAQLEQTANKLTEVTRERDLFSKLLSKGEGLHWPGTGASPTQEGASEQAVASLQAELAAVRARTDSEIEEAKAQARQQSEKAGKAEVEQAKSEALAAHLQEQVRSMSSTLELQKNNYSNLESQLFQAKSQLSSSQLELRKARDDVASHQAAEKRMRDEAAQLRAEKEQWESQQARLQSDFATVQQERAKLQYTIDSFNNVSTANERTRAEERAQLQKRIEELQAQSATLRSQVDQARQEVAQAQKKVEETDARIATETAAIRTEKEAAEALVASKSAEVDTKTAELEKAQQQVGDAKRIGLNWQRRAKELTDKVAELTAASGNVSEKEAEVAKLTTELEEAKAKITTLEENIKTLEGKVTEAEQSQQTKDAKISLLESDLAAAQASGAAAGTAATAAPDAAELTNLKAERDSLQERLNQAEKDLEAAKAVASAAAAAPDASAAPAAVDTTELQSKIDELTQKLADKETQYENDVRKVNKVNASMNARIKGFGTERAGLDEKIAALEKEVADLKAKLATAEAAAASSGAEGGAAAAPSQEAIDEAVKAAVSKRESELAAEHQAALASATASASTGGQPDEAAIKAAVDAKEAELKAAYETQLAAAKAEATAAAAAGSGSDPAQASKIEELEKKIKALERQARTAEISRKTLERQKTDLEAKLAAATGTNGATTPALSPAAAPFKPASTTTPTTRAAAAAAAQPAAASAPGVSPGVSPTGADTATTTAAAPPTGSASGESTPAPQGQAQRGGAPIRGTRGRGATTIRGRSAAPGRSSILGAVNATLAAEAGTKRPAPDDESAPTSGSAPAPGTGTGASDILQRLNQQKQPGAAAGTTPEGTTPPRAVKRPRAAAPRGRGTGRRQSAAGGGAGGGQAGGGAGGGGGDGGGAGGA